MVVSRWLIDGRATQHVASDDRGLAYGDGVFRTMRVRAGRVEAWATHMERLFDDCARLALRVPAQSTLAADAQRLVLDAGAADAVLKIVITRGSGGRGYAPPDLPSVRRLSSIHPLPVHARDDPESLALDWSSIALGRQPLLAGIKHLNRLEQVLARADCQRRGIADAVMRDSNGWLIATTMRNLMFRTAGGEWHTPALDQAGVRGATRERLAAALASAGTPVLESRIRTDDIRHCDAVMACNSIGGIASVACIAETEFRASDNVARRCRRLLEKS
ncbi:MAG: aminodeoxychorismate lyase [Salinisphaera sp.]|jgi:4-amino-4-deoxychorismate lyase|nr:aminodeoxychorismate lyase [Salinisphaera sp.]